MRKLMNYGFALFISLGTLVGCANGGETNSNVLRVAKDVELASMDQHVATDGLSFESIAASIEGLYSLDANGEIIPAIALEHELSEDAMTYTFKLREDATWDNGTPVTAHDFVYAWRRLVNPDTASEYGYIMGVAGVKNADAVNVGDLPLEDLGVSATDDHTFVVELDRPVAFFLQLMTFSPFYPLNEEFVVAQGDAYAQTPENLLANGAFKMTDWTPGHSHVYEKNESYYDEENVALDGLEFKIIKDPQTAVLEYEAGNLDVVRLSGEIVNKYKDNPAFTTIKEGYLWYAAFNLDNEYLANENIRLALAHAYNKDQLTSTVLNDGSTPANFIVPEELAVGPDGLDFRETSPTFLEYDVQKAQAYWEAGLNELGVDSLTFELLFEDTESIKKSAEYLQSELQTNLPGLTINLKSQPKKNRLDLMREGSYEIGLTRWGPDYADPTTYLDMFYADSTYNFPNYINADYDALMNQINRGDLSTNIEARWEALKEAEAMLLSTAPLAPLFQQGNTYLMRETVSGVETHTVGLPTSYKNVTIE